MSGAELIRAAGPVFWILFALSVYTLYLVLAGLFRRKATARTLDRLGDLAQFAPLLGLFGTSLGMIRAFLALGQGGTRSFWPRASPRPSPTPGWAFSWPWWPTGGGCSLGPWRGEE